MNYNLSLYGIDSAPPYQLTLIPIMKIAFIQILAVGLSYSLIGQEAKSPTMDWDMYEIGLFENLGDHHVNGPHLIFQKSKESSVSVSYVVDRVTHKSPPKNLRKLSQRELDSLLTKLYEYETKAKKDHKKVAKLRKLEVIKENKLREKNPLFLGFGGSASAKLKVSITSGGKKKEYWYQIDRMLVEEFYPFLLITIQKYKLD